MNLAICDDEPEELARISSLLGSIGWKKKRDLHTEPFKCRGSAGRDETENFDLLLLDVIMPGLDGYRRPAETGHLMRVLKSFFSLLRGSLRWRLFGGAYG
jgi:DNA-binding response OmpR family regulator